MAWQYVARAFGARPRWPLIVGSGAGSSSAPRRVRGLNPLGRALPRGRDPWRPRPALLGLLLLRGPGRRVSRQQA
eukprot:4758581-Pyramimonas_sp.AAC.1